MLKDSSSDCTLCGGAAKELFQKNSFSILQCDVCQHRFSTSRHQQVEEHVAKEYQDEYFAGGESCYDNYSDQRKDLIRQGKYYSKILRKHGRFESGLAPRVLDVGAAAGFMLEGFVQDGWHGVGLEANESIAKFGREEVELDVRHGLIEQFMTDELFEAATLVQLLPHLINPIEAIRSIRDLLKDEGLLLIETWDHKSLTARGFGKWWHEYNPPSVLHWFTKPLLRRILTEAGYEVIGVGRPTKWISLGNGFAIARKSVEDSALARTLLSPTKLLPASFKVPYFFDDVFWMVARKKA